MLVYRSSVAAAVTFGALLVGCDPPDQPTDLRTEGPPVVTTVTVMSDVTTPQDLHPPGLARLTEIATYCRPGDEKRPSLVGLPDFSVTEVCPETLSEGADEEEKAVGAPPAWYVRVVFDQLLDPDVEDLVDGLFGNPLAEIKFGTLENTLPVDLSCNGVAVSYNRPIPNPPNMPRVEGNQPISYYIPNGNRVSWPLGPALLITPSDPLAVPLNSDCQLDLKSNAIKDKEGLEVSGARSFKFKTGIMEYRFSIPDFEEQEDNALTGNIVVGTNTPLRIFFTAAFDLGSFPLANVTIRKGANPEPGKPNTAVCGGTGGALVADGDKIKRVRPLINVDNPVATPPPVTSDLTLEILTKVLPEPQVWDAQTTYLIEIASGTQVTAVQTAIGNNNIASIPDDYKICFHTRNPPPT